MDLKDIAEKLKAKIQGGKLCLDNSVINDESFKFILQFLPKKKIELIVKPEDIVVTDDKTMAISGKTSLYNISGQSETVISINDDKTVDSEFTCTIGGLNFTKLISLGLIPTDIYDPSPLLPTLPFDEIDITASSKKLNYELASKISKNKINLLSNIGLSLENLGFCITQTMIPFSENKDTQLLLFGTFNLGKTSIDVNLTVPISQSSVKNQWNLSFFTKTTLAGEIQDITQLFLGFNIFEFLPPGFSSLLNFSIEKLQINFDPVKTSIKYIQATISNPQPFTIGNSLEIKQVGLTLSWSKVDNKSSLSALVFGKFQIGKDDEPTKILLDVSMSMPSGSADWAIDISGSLENKGFEDVFKAMPGSSSSNIPALPIGLDLKKIELVYLTIGFNPASKTLSLISFNVQTELDFKIVAGVLDAKNPYAQFDIKNPLNTANRELTGKVGGDLIIGDVLSLRLQASKPASDSGWLFYAGMLPGEKLELKNIIDTFLKEFAVSNLPDWLKPDLSIEGASVEVQAPAKEGQNAAYKVKGKADWKLQYPNNTNPIIDTNVFAELEINYDKNKSSEHPYSGLIKGGVENVPLIGSDLELGYKFDESKKELFVQWRALTGSIITKGNDKIIQITIGDESVGSLITYLVGLATHNKNFQLDEPWNLLNHISLKGFKLSYNLSTKEVDVSYTLPKKIDLLFIVIEGITLKTENKKVMLAIDGSSHVGPAFDDLLNKDKGSDVQNLPGVPGKGNKYFDLRLLALGQHVEFETNKTEISEVIEDMRGIFKEPTEEKAFPLKLNPDNHWLFATNFGIMKDESANEYTVDLGIVFNDPELYGLKLKMGGKYAKVFKGLEFEILYKKITDSIGMFKAELTLPDSVRYLTFGEINIVLPVIGLEIFTNGDFKIDLGFPYDLNFSRSFAVSGIIMAGPVPLPLMGLGGIYFGKLSGPTSSKVPVTTKGLFNPVLEFGLGLQIGFGFVIKKGPLKAGFDVGVVGIIEGALAKFTPYNDSEIATTSNMGVFGGDYYYLMKGTIGIRGCLYGSVDFSVISASFVVEVYVVVIAELEAYNKMDLAIAAGLSISLTVKISLGFFSVKLHLSFSYRLEEKITIGEDRRTEAPWYDTPSISNTFMYAAIANTNFALNWKPILKEEVEKPIPLDAYFVPNLNVSYKDDIKKTGLTANYVATLFMDSHKDASDLSSFYQISEDIFRWAVYAGMSETGLTRKEIDEKIVSSELLSNINSVLNSDTITPILYDNIKEFIAELFIINIQLLTNSCKNLKNNELEATLFPIIPDLTLNIPKYKDAEEINREFSNYNTCTEDYLKQVKEYFKKLAVQVEKEQYTKTKLKDANNNSGQSFATYVFEDYFLLIARHLIQTGIDSIKTYKYTIKNDDSLQSIYGWAKNLSSDEMTYASIVTNNATHPLTPGNDISVGDTTHTVKDHDTFSSIANQHLVTLESIANNSNNQSIKNIFMDGKLNITGLESLKVSDIIENINQNDSIKQLSGMASRYHLHGLRLPIEPEKNNNTKSLFNFTGQQFELPPIDPVNNKKANTETYQINLKKDSGINWISFDSTDPNSLLFKLTDNHEISRINNVYGEAGKTSPTILSVKPIKNFTETAAHYSFKSVMKWNAKDEFNEAWLPLIWNFPNSLSVVLEQSKLIDPKFSIKIGEFNAVKSQMEYKDSEKNFWATLVKVTIKKRHVGDGNLTYDLIGADEKGVALLERLLLDLNHKGSSIIDDLRILYKPNPTADEKEGFISDGNNNIQSFITQSNLSNETNPPERVQMLRFMVEAEEPNKGILNKKEDFIRLLWQCSIVRSGGYSLFYNVLESNTGIPDSVFNEDGTGDIFLLISYSEKQLLSNYMNTAVTGDNINISSDVVFANSEAQAGINYAVKADDSLKSVKAQYHIRYGRLAELNKTKTLREGIKLKVRNEYYTINSKNPAGNTFESISTYYNIGIIALGSDSENIVLEGIFADGVVLDIIDELTQKGSIVSQGNTGFQVNRDNPGEVPGIEDPLYAEKYLKNLFSMLSYGLKDNEGFISTINGLPAGPLKNHDNEQNKNSKTKVTNEDENWVYKQIIPVNRYAKYNPIPENKDKSESDHPCYKRNPYSGIGQFAQFNYFWVDIYGNLNTNPITENIQPLYVGYVDKLTSISEWPSVGIQYSFDLDNDTPQLKVNFNFNDSRYSDPEKGKSNAKDDLEIYKNIYYQLNQKEKIETNSGVEFKNHVSLKFQTSLLKEKDYSINYDSLRNFILTIYQYLYQLVNSNTPTNSSNVDDVVLTKNIEVDYSKEGIFKDSDFLDLKVSLTFERSEHLIDDNFRDSTEVFRSVSYIKPQTQFSQSLKSGKNENTKNHSIIEFAKKFEDIFNKPENQFILKIATGIGKNNTNNSDGDKEIQVVKFCNSDSGSLSYHIKNAPAFYAPKPLSTKLESKSNVPFFDYTTEKGIDFSKPSSYKNLNGIDMDVWGKNFLEAVDLILSPEYSEPIFFVGKLSNNDFLKNLLDYKNSLAKGIQNHISNILEKDSGRSPEKVAVAKEKLYQQLLIELSNAYKIDAVIQYDVDVKTNPDDSNGGIAPRLFGKPELLNSDGSKMNNIAKDFSLSTGKISLQAGQESCLNLIFSTKLAKEQSNVPVNLNYITSHLEYEISSVKELSPYEISSWLSFAVPPRLENPASIAISPLKKEIGKTIVPVPLRCYPKPPSLTQQMGRNSKPGGKGAIENATNWDYCFTYSVGHAAQDIINAEIMFNLEPQGMLMALKAPKYNLFEELAEFNSVYNQIKNDFTTSLLKVNSKTTKDSPDYKNALSAVESFSKITERISLAWSGWVPKTKLLHGLKSNVSSVKFQIEETELGHTVKDIPKDSLVVKINPESLSDSLDIVIEGYTSEYHTDEINGFVYSKNTNGTKEYLQFEDALAISDRQVAYKELNILEIQNALSSVSITRNETLIEGQKTSEEFIYRTPDVKFANRLIPLLTYDEEIDISKIGNTKNEKRTLENHLSVFFKSLLDKGINEAEIKLECKYEYPLNGALDHKGNAMVPITLPVLLATPFTFKIPADFEMKDCKNNHKEAFVCVLSDKIRSWLSGNKPLTEDAKLLFDISVFSQLNESKMPLVTLSKVVLPYDSIK